MSLLKLGRDNWARTSPAKDGVVFLILTFIIGFAALNTGNNLLYLIFGMMTSMVVISGILSMLNISSIDIDLKYIPRTFAMIPGSATLVIHNNKSIPCYSLTFRIGNNFAYLSHIPAKSTDEIRIKYFFSKRGWNDFPEIILNTGFPFGFFRKWIRIVASDQKILVFPNIHEISNTHITERNNSGEIESRMSGHGSELRTIREYETGDNIKYIHWKRSAKSGKLMVREFYGEEREIAKIVFDPEKDNYENIEHYISEKASVIVDYIEKGLDVQFITPGNSEIIKKSDDSLNKVLRYLALY